MGGLLLLSAPHTLRSLNQYLGTSARACIQESRVGRRFPLVACLDGGTCPFDVGYSAAGPKHAVGNCARLLEDVEDLKSVSTGPQLFTLDGVPNLRFRNSHERHARRESFFAFCARHTTDGPNEQSVADILDQLLPRSSTLPAGSTTPSCARRAWRAW